jgi:CRP-like cAMP-binding protein
MPEVVDARQTPLFAELTTAELNRLFTLMEPMQLSAGEVLFKEGDSPDGLYLLNSGSVEILKNVNGRTATVAELTAPAVLGEMGLIGGAGRTATVRARSIASAQRLPGEAYRRLVAVSDPAAVKILMALTRILIDRLATTTERLAKTLLQPERNDHRDLADLRDRVMRNWSV